MGDRERETGRPNRTGGPRGPVLTVDVAVPSRKGRGGLDMVVECAPTIEQYRKFIEEGDKCREP